MSLIKDKVYSFDQAKTLMLERIGQLDLTSKPSIFRIEIKIKPVDLIDWLEAQQSTVKIYGANQDNRAAIAGIGEALSLKAQNAGRFSKIFEQLRQYLTPQYPYLQWYGGFCFDDGYLDQNWKDFGAYRFVLPRFELARDHQKMIFCCNLVGSLQEKTRKSILRELEGIKTKKSSIQPLIRSVARKDLPTEDRWNAQASVVIKNIPTQYQKLVLARKTVLEFVQTPNALDIFRKLYKVTPQSYHFYFQFGQTIFLGASPERLYKRQGRIILSEALAGTSPRGANVKEDKILKDQLKNSLKDNHEHQFVVEAIKEQLGSLCECLHHNSKPQIMSLSNGHHLITPFEGELKKQVKDEDILGILHPTPAVAGTPRKKVLAAIRQLEAFSRGWYAGPLGYVGLDWAEFVVGIRSGMIKNKKLSVYAGAGIVKGSDPKAEWLEVENKVSNFIKIIENSK